MCEINLAWWLSRFLRARASVTKHLGTEQSAAGTAAWRPQERSRLPVGLLLPRAHRRLAQLQADVRRLECMYCENICMYVCVDTPKFSVRNI